MAEQQKRANQHVTTRMVQANGAIDPQTGGVVPPIQSSTTFARNSDYSQISPNHLYARDDDDLVRLGEDILAKAENADAGLLFPSGMAAIAAVMRTVPNNGTIILQSQIYWGTTKWVRDFCARREINLHEIECSDMDVLAKTIGTAKPDLVFVETPSNPWLRVTDIAQAAALSHEVGAKLVVDSTAASPVLSNPLAFGADIVMHSATKSINGHSDVLAGFLATNDAQSEIWQAIAMDRHDAGAVLGSFEAWLLIRGMRTLPLRMERMCENTMAVATFLQNHPKVEAVLYPGLTSHEKHELATKQMPNGYGSLLSFQVKGDAKTALAVCAKLETFKRATSLGGVESLVEHRHSIEGDATGVPENLIRLSVGIEHIQDLIGDLNEALS
ncbi:trans-sulfuration enzyme family protein [Maritalea porphyrae]|uniref:trans-sulfuration enzyme family protein n=1 Tax=Maritalea porphyrae TaxID=880732 RepID=UPI0022B03A13|nr:aminotransferase class I/II-fold pyridoxal phosphate-dependent enzyme [Maritalea porphyrae]MCZ4273536.1 aminotransferase class I/II-fold pyridoxal phosphate-dependent enzyme [Maritalea porphyrae]